MNALYANWGPVLDLYLLHLGFALSQFIVLRAGVFSLATAGLAGIGAYTGAILAVDYGWPPALALVAAVLMGTGVALILSWPLGRLRGVYQAIATVAFVQIIVSVNIYAENLTGGAMGFTNIPKVVGTLGLLVAAVLATYVVWALNRSRIGRTFEAMRENEAVAVSLGVSITRYQALAFALSGALAGLFGALEAFHSYALDPNLFGFTFLIAILSYVVFGGRTSVAGPVVGTAVLILLPELARPLAENRILVYGALLILVINFMPKGIADTAIDALRRRRLAARGATREAKA
jgi:branched-chain amino acid transport system permease protein